ncbi:uncharacterized protein LOC119664617 [Teleopsis dalmanni]|uniref:uncharacterized protein LOC119664617 n=1 Tax=Teleopsis dalmanni TaxID=139649 RepID=UPI0018CEA7E8|nr:uncharacterized protein LOC119664617 [Teleopsis dalmanni]
MLSSASPSPSSNTSNIQINNTTLSQLFINQRLIESFLRKSILLKIIEAAASQYTKNYQQTKRPEDTLAAVIVQLPFAYKDFLDSPKELLNLTIDEPIQFMNAVKYCVYSLIRDFVKQTSSETGLKSIDIEQVHVQLRFIGLPYQQHLCFDPSKNLYPTNLCSVLGILTALTEPEKCVIQTVWFCSTGCLRNKIKKNSTEVFVYLCSATVQQLLSFYERV